MNEYQRARRFEDRTRWAPTCMISETNCRPVGYVLLDDSKKAIVRAAFDVIRKAMHAK